MSEEVTTEAAVEEISVLGAAAEEEKTEETNSTEQETGTEAEAAATDEGAGELEITLPDGVEFDAEILSDFKTMAKEAGLTSEGAGKFVALQGRLNEKAAEQAVQADAKRDTDWVSELKADPDFGGEHLKQTSMEAGSFLRQFGGESLAKELHDSGLGNHPGLIRMFARARRAIAEDSSGDRKGNQGAPKSRESKLANFYNNSQSE